MDSGITDINLLPETCARFRQHVAFERIPEEEDHRNVRGCAPVASQAQLPDRLQSTSAPWWDRGAAAHPRSPRTTVCSFHAIASDCPIPADKLAWVGNALHDCCAKRCLSIAGAEVRWTWRPGARCGTFALSRPHAATDLLTAEHSSNNASPFVRQCEDAGCGWLFLDRFQRPQRRLCSMVTAAIEIRRGNTTGRAGYLIIRSTRDYHSASRDGFCWRPIMQHHRMHHLHRKRP